MAVDSHCFKLWAEAVLHVLAGCIVALAVLAFCKTRHSEAS
jgi:hypothetical protein